MNYLLVAKYLGHFSAAIGALMLPSAAWAVYYGEWGGFAALIESAVVAFACGGGLMLAGRRAPAQMFQRETLALVSLGWLLTAGLGALPYIFSGVLDPISAYFESMSGFTTTGSTVFVNIEAVDKCLLFWRSFTHWLGGMGIIMLFIAVLPYIGAGGKQMFKSEYPGPEPRSLSPHIRDTASMLWKIYLGFTVAETVLLMFAGMNLFDALCHTFGTLATGGFSPRNASVAAFDSVAIELIILFFMAAAGSNFTLYFAMLRGKRFALWRNTEWRFYIGILLVGTLLITANLMGLQGQADTAGAHPQPGMDAPDYPFAHALRVAAFQVVSLMTTTGYCTDNYDLWPHFSRMLLVVLMFVGGSAGSTGGGIKVIRFIMLAKIIYRRIESNFRPKTYYALRIDDQVVEEGLQRTVLVFMVLYIAIFAFGCLFMSALGLPFQTAIGSVAATLNNVGPGLELVGAVGNYEFVPAAGKVFLSLCMVLGRLELFSICVLFLPSFWRHS
jgi:trk system potassium uptake protein TrkH